MRTKVLQLYKQLMRYGESLEFTDKKYFRYRIRKGFRENQNISVDDKKTLNFYIEVKKHFNK